MQKQDLYARLSALLEQSGLSRVHPDATQPTARLALEALAGLPPYEQIWAGDLNSSVQIVAVASGERLPGVELARRALLLAERGAALSLRVKGFVQAVQLVVYERAIAPQELSFVLSKARVAAALPFARGKVATWLISVSEPAVHAKKLRGWPVELSPPELRKLLQ
jgi:hypothetical protein